MESSSSAPPSLNPILARAAGGTLPPWAEARESRREHMTRVADLLEAWAEARGEHPTEVHRWKAAGHLHDALRDADPEGLRGLVGPSFQELPGKVLHGPGVAARLRESGVTDEEFLHAVAFHTLGSGEFRTLGMALYSADFLDPGRKNQDPWRAALRVRASRELEAVAKEILLARIRYQLEKGRPLHPETVAFWNRMSEGQHWASASEL